MLFEEIGSIMNVAGFYLIRDWKFVILYLYLIPTIIGLVFMFIILVDTPIQLIHLYTTQEAVENFKKMASLNSIEDFQLDKNQITQIKEYFKQEEVKNDKPRKQSFFSLFSFKSLRYITIFACLLEMTNNFLYFGPVLLMDSFNLNIFINGSVMGGANLLSAIACILIISKCRRIVTAIICMSLCLISSLVLVFLWDQNSQIISQNIVIYLLIFLFRLAINTEYTFAQVYIN